MDSVVVRPSARFNFGGRNVNEPYTSGSVITFGEDHTWLGKLGVLLGCSVSGGFSEPSRCRM